jgi:hypothetical protein
MFEVIFPNSHWGSNIGNPFFTLGAAHILSSVSPDVKIHFTDMLADRAFQLNKSAKKNALAYSQFVEGGNAVLLCGPMFDLRFGELFLPILKRAKKAKTKIFIMSAGGIEYTKEEVDYCRSILSEYPPYILTTRDSDTYNNYADLSVHAYDGICTAWFVPDYYTGYDTPGLDNYITSTFDTNPEPKFLIEKTKGGVKSEILTSVRSKYVSKISRLFQRGLPDKVGGLDIIRPCHATLHRANRQLFFKPNSFASMTPYGYLNLYRNSKLTITDRLHAAVATLAYGNPAQLFIKSARAKLLDRVGCGDVTSRQIKADLTKIEDEKDKYYQWINQVVLRLLSEAESEQL